MWPWENRGSAFGSELTIMSHLWRYAPWLYRLFWLWDVMDKEGTVILNICRESDHSHRWYRSHSCNLHSVFILIFRLACERDYFVWGYLHNKKQSLKGSILNVIDNKNKKHIIRACNRFSDRIIAVINTEAILLNNMFLLFYIQYISNLFLFSFIFYFLL